ncbi:MAG: ferrous iron transporter B [Phycisphaerales bacterium]
MPTATTGQPTSAPPPETPSTRGARRTVRVALLGNPNTGKTTIFNRLCGLRAKTANFPGITVDARVGLVRVGRGAPANIEVVDLPGVYRLALDMPEARLCRETLDGAVGEPPDAAVVIVDATNLSRNLRLVVEALRYGRPTIVALNMIDIAQRRGVSIDAEKLGAHLGCPVVPVCGRTGSGLGKLRDAIFAVTRADHDGEPHGDLMHPTNDGREVGLPDPFDHAAVTLWADRVVEESIGGDLAIGLASDTVTERLDKAFTHPFIGAVVFHLAMAGLFTVIFWLASYPMDWIETVFATLGSLVATYVPEGAVHDLLVDGVIGGLAGTVVFIPQICLLFFLISLLEDTGYLARAAFVMDRVMCRFGLPGQAFVPLLSSHACAIPGIMSTRLIPDPQDRLATILVAPFMSCTARIPVYVLLTSLLFAGRPWLAAIAFIGCYALGAAAAMVSAVIARRTILKGKSRPMVLELPSYKWPSVRNALLTTWDRGWVFLRNAGTVIMAICIVMWWLSAYPKVDPPAEALALQAQAEAMVDESPELAAEMSAEAEEIAAKYEQRHSFAGYIGRAVQPVFAPLGYDWQLSVGVMTSFAAREVFVSTMAVLLTGDEEAEIDDEGAGVITRIRESTRSDGETPVFTMATSASLLVFYVLAMQCLPTLAVTKRETGSWKWAGLQLVYMSLLAYVFALGTYQGLTALGVT